MNDSINTFTHVDGLSIDDKGSVIAGEQIYVMPKDIIDLWVYDVSIYFTIDGLVTIPGAIIHVPRDRWVTIPGASGLQKRICFEKRSDW